MPRGKVFEFFVVVQKVVDFRQFYEPFLGLVWRLLFVGVEEPFEYGALRLDVVKLFYNILCRTVCLTADKCSKLEKYSTPKWSCTNFLTGV